MYDLLFYYNQNKHLNLVQIKKLDFYLVLRFIAMINLFCF